MADKLETVIRNYIEALEKRDLDRALSFFTDDATWYTSEGVFKGKEELKKYTSWMFETVKDLKFADDGIGIVVQGSKAVYQHTWSGINEGTDIKVESVCTYEFRGDKCKSHWTINDRLLIAKQAATGFIARKAVGSILKQIEKGLH